MPSGYIRRLPPGHQFDRAGARRSLLATKRTAGSQRPAQSHWQTKHVVARPRAAGRFRWVRPMATYRMVATQVVVTIRCSLATQVVVTIRCTLATQVAVTRVPTLPSDGTL